jgi:hypothetical protein
LWLLLVSWQWFCNNFGFIFDCVAASFMVANAHRDHPEAEKPEFECGELRNVEKSFELILKYKFY